MTTTTANDDDNGQHPQYLEPSELGTKEYWETFYTRSLEHIASKTKTATIPTPKPDDQQDQSEDREDGHDNDHHDKDSDDDDDDDPGTSWFSEHDAPRKVLRYLTSRKFPLSPRNRNKNGSKDQQQQQEEEEEKEEEPSILDLGTGNGSMLALLRKRGGFKGVMVGVDYSAQSVQLARELQRLKMHSAYESGGDSEEEEEDDDEDEEEYQEEEEVEHEDVVVAATTSDNNNSSNDNNNAVVHAEAIPVQEQDIRFEEWDILDPANEDMLSHHRQAQGKDEDSRIPWFPYHTRGFDIVLDKGTFDAISLSDETTTSSQPAPAPGSAIDSMTESTSTNNPQARATTHICHKYPVIATQLVRPGGFLIVTSCNWTEDELIQWFTAKQGPQRELEVWHKLEYPRFRFGGHEGQGVCTVCFRRSPAA